MQTRDITTPSGQVACAELPARVGVRAVLDAIVAAMDVGLGCAIGLGFDWSIADAARVGRVVPAAKSKSR